MKHLRQYIRQILKESPEDTKYITKIMMLYDNEEWEQAHELADILGLNKHPDIKFWHILDPEETGNIMIHGLSYDEATSPKYLAFAYIYGGYHGGSAHGANASKYPPTQQDFDDAWNEMVSSTGITNPVPIVDEEAFSVSVEY